MAEEVDSVSCSLFAGNILLACTDESLQKPRINYLVHYVINEYNITIYSSQIKILRYSKKPVEAELLFHIMQYN
jgi:hypothetical protein